MVGLLYDKCPKCGHQRSFHSIGTGNGVPAGEPFCDDRYGDPCDCTHDFSAESHTRELSRLAAAYREAWERHRSASNLSTGFVVIPDDEYNAVRDAAADTIATSYALLAHVRGER